MATVLVLGMGLATAGAATPAAATPSAVTALASVGYRHGSVPMVTPATVHQGRPKNAAANNNLVFGGGNGSVGVTTGAPKVYLVFWGSQWGSPATNAQGNLTLTGDPMGMAPILQGFLKGLGTGGETWSGVMTQYCEGVAAGAQACPANASHVGYPVGGALAGVWADTTSSAPSSATGHQLAVEAVAAANHFGNLSQASNRNTQYLVVSPTGATPDGFNTASGNFCSWHDFSGDSTLPGGGAVNAPFAVAFTNMPYLTDGGSTCGANFVNPNPAGVLDGVSIVAGHEYAETITDQFPIGGWLDAAQNENGDKCAWIAHGQGASQNIVLSTGTFAVQSTWANDFNGGTGGCLVSHPTVGPAPTQATMTYPTDGQSNADTTQPFAWSPIAQAQGYVLVIGSTRYGADLANSGVLPPTQSSVSVPALPTGATLHATLFTEVNGGWTNYQAISFTAAPGQAAFTAPLGGQAGIDPTRPITWSTIPQAQGYILVVGTFQYGANVVNSGVLAPSQSSFAPPTLPAGQPLFATLLTKVNGAFTRFQAITFTARAALGTFTSPMNGQVNVSTPNPFVWSPIAGAQNYWLVVGTTMYGADLVSSGLLGPAQSSFNVPALPQGRLLYATLLTKVDGAWAFQLITFTT